MASSRPPERPRPPQPRPISPAHARDMGWLMGHWGDAEPHAGKYVAVLDGTLYVGETREEAIGKARIASGDPAADPVCMLIPNSSTVFRGCFD